MFSVIFICDLWRCMSWWFFMCFIHLCSKRFYIYLALLMTFMYQALRIALLHWRRLDCFLFQIHKCYYISKGSTFTSSFSSVRQRFGSCNGLVSLTIIHYRKYWRPSPFAQCCVLLRAVWPGEQWGAYKMCFIMCLFSIIFIDIFLCVSVDLEANLVALKHYFDFQRPSLLLVAAHGWSQRR